MGRLRVLKVLLVLLPVILTGFFVTPTFPVSIKPQNSQIAPTNSVPSDPELTNFYSDGVATGYHLRNGAGDVIVYSNGGFAVVDESGRAFNISYSSASLVISGLSVVAFNSSTVKKSIIIGFSLGSVNFTATNALPGIKVTVAVNLPVAMLNPSFNFSFRVSTNLNVVGNVANSTTWQWNYKDAIASGFLEAHSFNGKAWNQKFTKTGSITSLKIDPMISKTTSYLNNLPETEARIFQNTRGQKGFYMFYRNTVSGSERCYYAYSSDGISWTANQTIDSLPANHFICTVTFREDSANSRSVVYIATSRGVASTGTTENIQFIIGTIADASLPISWGSTQTVRATDSSENESYPTMTIATDGFLHIAFAYETNKAGTASDTGNVIVCSTSTTVSAFGTNAPTWMCSNPLSTDPFFQFEGGNQQAVMFMPMMLSQVVGHDAELIAGMCQGGEQLPCIGDSTNNEFYITFDWDGTTRTFGTQVSRQIGQGDFNCYLFRLPAESRSTTVNATSGLIYYAWTSDLCYDSFTFAAPYDSNSFSANIRIETLNGQTGELKGLHLTINSGATTSKLLMVFYAVTSLGLKIFSRNTTMTNAWSAKMTEYTNATKQPQWPQSPAIVNPSSASTQLTSFPIAWVNFILSSQAEVWTTRHSLQGVAPPPSKPKFTLILLSLDALILLFIIVPLSPFLLFVLLRRRKKKKGGQTRIAN